MHNEIRNIELSELSKIENFDRITILVCKNNKLIDLQKILRFKNNNSNFLSLEYSNSEVNQKLLAICDKYEKQPNNSTIDFAFCKAENTDQIQERIIPNYSLEKLAEIEKLAVRGYNACRYNKLLTLSDLLDYYKENGHFLNVRNCGKKSNDELITICKKYISIKFGESMFSDYKEDETIDDIQKYTLQQLASKEKLSVRVQNVCNDNGLHNLPQILDYYYKHFNFNQLRNCGSNSSSELIKLCEKYKNLLPPSTSEINQKSEFINPLTIKIENLTTKQKAVLNNIIYSKFSQLSARSQNALSSLLHSSITIRTFKEEFFEVDNYDFKKNKNVGDLTENEIESFINEVRELVDLVSLFEDCEILREYYNSYLIKEYQVSTYTINKIGNNYDFSLGYPIFKTVFYLIDGNYLLDEKEKLIFFGLFNIFYNATPPLISDFKSNLKLTRERIRQIRNNILKKLPFTFNRLFNLELNYENFYTYQISQNSDFINLTDDDVLKINRNEGVNFNSQFMVYIFSFLLKDTHALVGDKENLLLNKSGKYQHLWNNFYLIQKDLIWIFDFEKLIQDVHNRISSRIEEDYKFYFQSYLLNFQIENCTSKLDTITSICESILFAEFEMVLDTEENIIFRKNTKKQVVEYVYEILEEKNEPLTIYELFDLVEKKYPNVSKSAEALRGSCQGDSKLIFFGRSSTYALKVWEEEKDIRGGTIRDIAEEFLLEQTEPKHINEITDFVNRYRDTNAKNIYANLKMEENCRFVFFKGLLVGLKCKKYNDCNLIKTENVQVERETWAERFKQLKTFALNYSRLPNSSGIEFEQQLYRFLNVQLNKVEKGKIEQDKALLINELVTKYNYKKRKRINQKMNEVLFDVLEKFLVENERLPRANYEDEKRLYHFLFRQNKQFKNGSLNGEHLDKYLKIKNLLKNII